MYSEASAVAAFLAAFWVFQIYKRYRKASYFTQLSVPLTDKGDKLDRSDETNGSVIDSESVAFDETEHGHVIGWDEYSLFINGERLIVCGGEFHYWRLPDKSEWARVLRLYKRAGWNTVRIYFHWGLHSPRESVYFFDDYKDIDFLLKLCSEIGLYVLAAPGPYICAETQAGGLPIWLAQKKNVRLRHNVISGIRKYDAEYSAACEEWFTACLPIIAKHQITNKGAGCVIALQLENENFEELPLDQMLPRLIYKILNALNIRIPFGVHDDMRHLAYVARRSGITVPFFSNDAWEAGSFMVKPDEPERFGLDLYGFDKYFIFAPVAKPLGALGNASYSKLIKDCKGLEHRVREFMSKANRFTPIFIPELQGGWFNHYTVPHTYDDIYKFYGREFTADLVYLMVSEGCTMYNLYIGYGGTNWGMLGDPDVYTSYDYSAVIREFRFLSLSGKLLRLANVHLNCFSEYWAATSPTLVPTKIEPSSVVIKQRLSLTSSHIAMGPVVFTFFHPTTHRKSATVSLRLPQGSPLREEDLSSLQHGWCQLEAGGEYPLFVSVSNYRTVTGVVLLWSMLAIHAKTYLATQKVEVWFVQVGTAPRDMLFYGSLSVKQCSSAQFASLEDKSGFGTSLKFNGAGSGFVLVEYTKARSGEDGSDSDNESASPMSAIPSANSPKTPESIKSRTSGLLLIIGLDANDITSLHQARQKLPLSANVCEYFAWGSSNVEEVYISENSSKLEVSAEISHCSETPTKVHVLLKCDADLPTEYTDECFGKCPFIKSFVYANPVTQSVESIDIKNWECSPYSFSDMFAFAAATPGQLIELLDHEWTDPLDYGFVSGHITYRTSFAVVASNDGAVVDLPDKSIILKLNQRHRASVWCNGCFVGGNVVYNLRMFNSGAKVGPDPGGFNLKFGEHLTVFDGKKSLGVKTFDLSSFIAHGNRDRAPVTEFISQKKDDGDIVQVYRCEIVVLVESWGLNRQAFFLNDIRNPRGILSAEIKSTARMLSDGAISKDIVWEMAGVDATKDDCCFLTCGIPGAERFLENGDSGWNAVASQKGKLDLELSPNKGILFLRGCFDIPKRRDVPVPWRLSVHGAFTSFIWFNGLLVGRYYGNGDGPQHDFYLPDGMFLEKNNSIVFMNYTWDYAQPEIKLIPWVIDADGNLSDLDNGFNYAPEIVKFSAVC